MSVASSKTEGSKWIQTSVAVACMIIGYVLIGFFETLSSWFELESKVANYNLMTQVFSVVVSVGIFAYVMKSPKTSTFLQEVYTETVKVVLPDKNETVRHTIGIMIELGLWAFCLEF